MVRVKPGTWKLTLLKVSYLMKVQTKAKVAVHQQKKRNISSTQIEFDLLQSPRFSPLNETKT